MKFQNKHGMIAMSSSYGFLKSRELLQTRFSYEKEYRLLLERVKLRAIMESRKNDLLKSDQILRDLTISTLIFISVFGIIAQLIN